VPAGFPRIVESPTLKAVEKGRATVMLCSASGNPVPTVSWYKDLVPVDLTDPRLHILHTGITPGPTQPPTLSGNPVPTVSWYKDLVPVDLTDPRLHILHTGITPGPTQPPTLRGTGNEYQPSVDLQTVIVGFRECSQCLDELGVRNLWVHILKSNLYVSCKQQKAKVVEECKARSPAPLP